MASKFFSLIRARFFNQASDAALELGLNGEEHPRLRIDAGGRIGWGPGNAAADVNIYRSAANVLKTDDLFQAVLGLATLTSDGAPSVSAPDGTIAVDNTNDVFYFRSGDEWREVSVSGANVIVQPGEPSGAEVGDLWFDSDVDILNIYNNDQWVSVTGSLTLAGLTDVNLSSLENGQILKYSSANQEWFNEFEIPHNVDGGDAESIYGGIVAISGGGAAG
jgi:hypothetical protein